MTPPDTKSDEQARAEDRDRVGADAATSRAVDLGLPRRQRRATVGDEVDRAASRGVYADQDGRKRVVGAGQPVPDGWTREGDAGLAERAAAVDDTPTSPEDAGDAGTGGSRRGRRGGRSAS